MSISSLSPANFASLSAARISASANTSYTNKQLAAMTAAQIGAIAPVNMAAFNKSQIAAFNPQALASGLPTYLTNNNLTALPANVTSGLTNPQINLFSTSLVNASMAQMSAAQIGAINPAVVSTIGNNVLGALSGIQLNALKPLQAAQLSTGQLSGLTSEKVGTLSAAWLNKLTEPQIQSFAASSFTLTQLKGLDTVHVKALSGTQVAALGTAQLGVLAAKQIAAIDADDVGMMSANQFTVLTQPQLKALTTGQVDKLGSAQVLTITAKNIASLSYQQIQHFSDDVVTHLSGQQLGALTKQQIATGLDGRKIGLLSADQVKGFNKVQIQALTQPEVAALSVEDLAALTNTQLTAFKVDQLGSFTNAQITWVHDNKLDAGFAKGQLNKINERYAALPWTQLVGGTENDFGQSVATAVDGSVYVAGWTAGSIDGQANLGGSDYFVTKYAADGTKKWARQAGGTEYDVGQSVATAADGSVYVAGYTGGSIDGQANLGGYDGFVTKYAADGTKKWTRLVGGTDDDQAFSVATAADGSVYVAGYTDGSIDGQVNHGGGSDGFVTKYAADGTKQWTRLAGGTDRDMGTSVATAADGSVYVAGYTYGSIDGQSNHGGVDGFVTKYAANGNKQWTRLAGGTDFDLGQSVAAAADGSVYVGGQTYSSIDGQTYEGSWDSFVTKFAADGTQQWVRLSGGSGPDYGSSVATAADGSVYVSGETHSDSIDAQNNHGGYDRFVTKYAGDGTKKWTRLAGGTGDDNGTSVAIAADGSVYIAGRTDSSTIDGQANLGNFDAFVTKLVVT
jgi:hypothetical protein